MEISRRTDYAIRLIAALAASNGKPLSVRSAAETQEVPYAFARSIQHDLVIAGLVCSQRGAHGGMTLSRSADEITLLDIIECIQGPIGVAICAREENWCPRDAFCVFHDVWADADAILRDYFTSVSIKALLDGHKPYLTVPYTDPS
ncbi:MAG: Rrf2 family transcriptional regulator [Actinobacteria bacterium]|nr:Rrf2 family transcriptional regulator [Actinomycetota bacterium]